MNFVFIDNVAEDTFRDPCDDYDHCQYAVVSLAWNERLSNIIEAEGLEGSGIARFKSHVAKELRCDIVDEIRYCSMRKAYLFNTYTDM
mgnify:FL=1